MKSKSILSAFLALICVFSLAGCASSVQSNSTATRSGKAAAGSTVSKPASVSSAQSGADSAEPSKKGMIYLYGESHSNKEILAKELEIWGNYYEAQGMRHLFIEYSYYTAEFLNQWLKADNDEILDSLFKDFQGTAGDSPQQKEFYKTIKEKYPETIFHGTDVGHQYDTTGSRYLRYLNESGQTGTEMSELTHEAIKQGSFYYKNSDDTYRENKMVENFIREYDKLNGESVMGIYGSAHTGLKDMCFSGTVPAMANQLSAHYAGMVESTDLTKLTDALKAESITVNNKEYTALYFGEEDITSFSKTYKSRKFWLLENAYEDFKDKPRADNVLPYNNYPMNIKEQQIFVVEYTNLDDTKVKFCMISDDIIWEKMPATQEVILE